jgi:hypothetical protein
VVKKFRMLAIPLALILLAQTATPASIIASEQQVQAIKVAMPLQVEISLEKAITIVKQNFTVPAEFTEFTSGYNSYGNRQTWSLNWRTLENDGGSFMAQVDVNNGEIVNISSWKPFKPGAGLNIPTYSYSQATEIAQSLVNKILSDRLDELQLIPANTQIIPLGDYGPSIYTVQWRRVVNGVPFPSNGVTVQVNGKDGSVTGYNLNWNKGNFPSNQGVLGEVKAREAFEKNKLFELQYFMPYIIRPLSTTQKKAQAKLIYQLNNNSQNGAIDAYTGEPLKLNPGEWLANEAMAEGRGGMGSANKGAAEQSLTPEEQKEVEKNAQLLSKDEAIEAVKKWLEFPEGLILRNANLGADGRYNQNRVWSLDWNTEEAGKEGHKYIYARVDAVTGEVLGFNASSSYPGAEKPQILDRATVKGLADEFLKRIQPAKFQAVKYMESSEIGMKYPEDQVIQGFQYQRIVNGVPFPGNGLTVSIDTTTKKVVGFEMNWWDLDFPAVSNAMGQKKANDTFFAGKPLTLKYVEIYKNGMPGDIRLVYQPTSDNPLSASNRIDATTGKFLDWDGNPLSELPRPYTFKDIAGNFAEKEISLLGSAGIFGEYENEFKPNENVTVVSMLRGMLMAKNGAWNNKNLKDEDVLKQAKELGWLKEELAAESGINRELQAKLVIRMLQLEKIAQMEGLFQVPYEDATSFGAGSTGYIALTKGLGVIKVEGSEFEPAHTVTRAEAAYAIVKALGANR